MRKLILGLAVSLDGFIEGPNGEIDWCFTDQDYGMKEFLEQADALFMGRKTYELVLKMQGGSGFPQLKEYIFSNSLSEVKEGSILIRGNVKEAVLQIKESPGKNIWLFGGTELTQSLMKLRLVDEIWLSIHPVILGNGKPIFGVLPERINLSFIASKAYSSGLVSVKYQVI